MNKRIVFAVLSCMAYLLSGCQLAVPGAEGAYEEPDRLIGACITTEYIDLQDEGYISENMSEIVSSGGITLSNADPQKIYAQESASGFIFPGVDGMNLLSYYKKAVDGNSDTGYWTSDFGVGISDVHNKYHSSDNSESVEQTATIYVAQDAGEVMFYMNPVYQTEEGEVYLVPGTGIQMSTALSGTMNQAIREESKMRADGEEITYTCEYELTVTVIDVPTEIILIQMNEAHKEIARSTYNSGELPEELKPEEGTAYILIEEHCGNKVVRTVNQPGLDTISSYYRIEDGLCVEDTIKILWPEQ